MRLAHEADAADDPSAKVELVRKAFAAEREAADLLFGSLGEEPSRSVLYRSAAVLALDCREVREAERLATAGLAGYPPGDIATELREVLDRAHFQRYLSSLNIELTEDEFELNMVGPATVTGFASERIFFPRYRATQHIFYRTAERMDGLPFASQPRKETTEKFSFLFSPPREASFAVTVRVTRNLSLPGMSHAGRVMGEVVECMELFNQGRDAELDERLGQTEYRMNFHTLARQLAPDGKGVTLVSLTSGPMEDRKVVSVTRTGGSALLQHEPVTVTEIEEVLERGRLVVRGTLAWADSIKKRKTRYIKIEPAEGRPYKVAVAGEIMHDVVSPYYEQEVEAVLGISKKGKYYLIDIRPI